MSSEASSTGTYPDEELEHAGSPAKTGQPPEFGDLVYVGRQAGRRYAYNPIRLRVFEAAECEQFLIMSGTVLRGQDPDEEEMEPLERRVVLARVAGVRILERSKLDRF